MERFVGLIGIVVMLLLAWLMSEDRRRFPWRMAAAGILMQFALALLLLKTPGVVSIFDAVARIVNGAISRADAGIIFLFGEQLGMPTGPLGFVFAVRALPVIIFFASLMAVLYHLGVMQKIVSGLAWLLRGALGVSAPEALAMASNVFVGQTEAPLCIKPYLERMTRSQMATVMVGGFATIAGSVLAAYVGILGGVGDAAEPQRVLFIKHLLTASVMSAPAAFIMARIIAPERPGAAESADELIAYEAPRHANLFDAAAAGATDGMKLAANVGAMLIAFVALLSLINWPLEALGQVAPVKGWLASIGAHTLSLQTLLGWLFTPLAWSMGVPSADCAAFGSLLGEKLVATEFIAYSSLGEMMHAEPTPLIGSRAAQLAAYALCGFANFASIGIQIGGLTSLAPNQRRTIVTLGLRAMFAGALASWLTACIAGVLI